MPKRMTVIFEDEELYTSLKVEAIRRGRHAKDVVSEAVREWLEAREDEEMLPMIEEARAEWKEKGGRPWPEVEKEIDEAVSGKEKQPEARSV